MKKLTLFLSTFGCLFLTSCSFFNSTDMHLQRSYIESATTYNRPITEPVRAITSFSDSLACMDKLLYDENVETTAIAVKFISDPSGKTTVAAKDMVFTALSQMSRTSRAFKIVDLEASPIAQDTVQNITNAVMPTGQMRVPRPRIYISGAVTYVDQNILNRNSGLGFSNSKVDLGVSGDMIVSAIGLDLHVGEFVTRTLYPGIDSANEITAANRGFGIDAGAEISKAGVNFSFGSGHSQGSGPAVRTLVELGTIELVGKWARVPYWQCLVLDQAHPEFQRELLSWYDDMLPSSRVRFFQTGLKTLGYYDGEINGKTSEKLKQALSRYQADNKAVPSGMINFETYERLMKNYVATDSKGNFERIGWNKNQPKPRDNMPVWGSDPVQTANFRISLNKREPIYYVGEPIYFKVNVSRMSYVNCFYQDSSGSVMQIYPSMFQPAGALQAGLSISIPDADNPNSFVIEATSPGKEQLSCVTSKTDISDLLRKRMKIFPLEEIRGPFSLNTLKLNISNAGKNKVDEWSDVTWTIKE